MKKEKTYEIAYIISKYVYNNIQYLSGTFSRMPIYKSILENYSCEEIRKAFEFLDSYGILRSSVRESDGFIIIYGYHKYKMKMFIDLFWGECEYSTKKDCKKILSYSEYELIGGVM